MGLNISQLSIAYSPKSDVLDDVLRSAVVNLFAQNILGIMDMINDHDNITLPEIPPDIELNSTIYEIAKRLVRVTEYKSSKDLIRIYSDEQSVREVIAAVEFDDQLLGSLNHSK